MKLLYFAWLKEHTGQASEELHLPDGVKTVGALIPAHYQTIGWPWCGTGKS